MTKGDKITLVFETTVTLGEVDFGNVDVDYILTGPQRYKLDDEGVLWLKGWRMPDEACVVAARACQALRKDQEQQTQAPFGLPAGVLSPGLPSTPQPGPPPAMPWAPPLQPGWPGGSYPTWPGVNPNDHTLIVSTATAKGQLT